MSCAAGAGDAQHLQAREDFAARGCVAAAGRVQSWIRPPVLSPPPRACVCSPPWGTPRGFGGGGTGGMLHSALRFPT